MKLTNSQLLRANKNQERLITQLWAKNQRQKKALDRLRQISGAVAVEAKPARRDELWAQADALFAGLEQDQGADHGQG